MGYQLITTINNQHIYCVLINEKEQLIEVNIEEYENASLIGNIYIGKVTNFVKGFNIAFVNIGLEKDVFMQLDKKRNYLFTNERKEGAPIRVGDEILVEVTKEAHMHKPPSVTSNISISGKYSILTFNKSFVGISSKIEDQYERNRLKKIFKPYVTDYYGFIVRTNANQIDDYILVDELETLTKRYNKLVNDSRYKTCFSCLFKQPHIYIKMIRDLYHKEIDEYIFDYKGIYDESVKAFDRDINQKMRLVETDNYNLYKLFSLEKKINDALNKKVFLKSGGTLVIEHTEALTVIDVNSGKSSSKKKPEKAIFDINYEAAIEIGRQLRLRNISGIIIIDFIDMKYEKNNQRLIEHLKRICNRDRTKTTVVDITPLGLVEITRKKAGVKLVDKIKKIDNVMRMN